MAITANQEIKLRRLIEEYANAKVEKSWVGNKHPDDHDDIEQEFKKATKKLENFLIEITQN